MKKIISLIIIIFISIILSAIYGVNHNFIMSHISPEFYTKFTFFNFGILDDYGRKFSGNWTFALIWVGFFSTWWFGLFTGLIFGIIALKYNIGKQIFNKTFDSFFIIIVITILFGFIGYIIAEINPSEIITNYNLPFEIEHKIEFNKVAKINIYSYFGGIIGLIIGTYNQVRTYRRNLQN